MAALGDQGVAGAECLSSSPLSHLQPKTAKELPRDGEMPGQPLPVFILQFWVPQMRPEDRGE